MAKRVLSGKHFMSGNHAIAEGCLAAGVTFFGGYPITPSSEVAEHMAKRLFQVGGTFVQFEDEIASMAGILGAAWAGAKSMTATSGPGISLMQENIGLGVMMETPTVIINIQRGGPSTGLPTLVGQQDIMQARWGSHGDYRLIAMAPNSVQEAFDFSIACFNYAEEYRVPVIMLSDESIGHMTEGIEIPPEDEIMLIERPRPKEPPEAGRHYPYRLEEGSMVPPMAVAGEGYKVFSTGLTHDERGYPDISAETQEVLVRRLIDKIDLNRHKIVQYETFEMDDADLMVVAYGITSRVVKGAIIQARAKGIKVGMFRPKTIWPMAEEEIAKYAEQVEQVLVVEINAGQYFYEVQRVVEGRCPVQLLPKMGGAVHTLAEVLGKIEEMTKGGKTAKPATKGRRKKK